MGWKRVVTTPSESATFLVEREPMWDGNLQYATASRSERPLSENQCGMETENEVREVGRGSVEREPMWDGNGLTDRLLGRSPS